METVQKKPVYKRLWFWVLAVFILFVIAASGSGGGNAVQTADNTADDSVVADTDEATETEATWQEVKTWSGNGIKKTEPFTITGKQWRVTWTNKSGYLGVSVYKPGNSYPIEMLVNTADATSDVSYVYKTGEFYLDVNSSGAWELTVEELK